MARLVRLNAWLSTPMILLSAVAYAAYIGTGWSWPLFLWGCALGPVEVFALRRVAGLAMSVAKLTPEQKDETRRASWERYRPLYVSMTGMSVAAGIISASSQDAFAVAGFTVLGLLGVVLPLLVLPRVARETAATSRTAGSSGE